MKVGRNDHCPCGSGKKFEKCHPNMAPIGALPFNPEPLPGKVLEDFERHRHQEMIREATFGKVRPIIQIPAFADKRLVAVRNRLYWRDMEHWKFFSDFLFDYS